MTEEANQRLRDSLAAYKRIIVAVSEQKLSPYQTFFGKFTTEAPVIYAFFTQGKMMLQIQRAVARASAVVLGHSPNEDVQRQVADVLFAKATADGRLSASLGELFQAGDGVTITPKHLCILFRKNMGFLLSPCNELIRSLWTVYVRELIPVAR